MSRYCTTRPLRWARLVLGFGGGRSAATVQLSRIFQLKSKTFLNPIYYFLYLQQILRVKLLDYKHITFEKTKTFPLFNIISKTSNIYASFDKHALWNLIVKLFVTL